MQASSPAYSEALEFLRTYGYSKLHTWSDEEVLSSIHQSALDNSIAWSRNEAGRLTGIVLGRKDEKTKTLHIITIALVKGEITLRDFLHEFYRRFPGYTLTGYREKQRKTLRYV